jgi:hypothetical protein
MKDAGSIWGQLSAMVNERPGTEIESLGRGSSVVVNRLFGNTVPVRPDGRPNWSRRKSN